MYKRQVKPLEKPERLGRWGTTQILIEVGRELNPCPPARQAGVLPLNSVRYPFAAQPEKRVSLGTPPLHLRGPPQDPELEIADCWDWAEL